MIKAVGNKFYVLDSTGKKVLGKHSSKKKAVAQLQAIEISKQERNESRIIKFSDFLREEITSTLQYHQDLNPTIWDGFELKDDVRNKLIDIGDTSFPGYLTYEVKGGGKRKTRTNKKKRFKIHKKRKTYKRK